MRNSAAAVLLASIMFVACGDSPGEDAVVEGVAAVVTATSLDSDGACRLDDLLGTTFLLFDEDATVYAAGYSDELFCRLRVGMTREQVIATLSEPLLETWEYGNESEGTRCFVYLVGGRVSDVYGDMPSIQPGMTAREVRNIKGTSKQVTFVYTRRSADTHYRERTVDLVDDYVTRISAGVYVD